MMVIHTRVAAVETMRHGHIQDETILEAVKKDKTQIL